MNDFKGKVVLITGAGKGKGYALAEAFSRRGAFVAANDISPLGLDELVEKSNGKIKAYPEDVAKKIAVQTIVKLVEDDWGRIDILVNHAAVEPNTALLDMDEWDWHRTLDVNLTGAFLTMQTVGRVMREKGSGVMINLATLNPLRARDEGAYLASLTGLIALTRQAARELSPYHVHVHAIGSGISEFHCAEAGIPRRFEEAVMYLCQSPLDGQIVDLEES